MGFLLSITTGHNGKSHDNQSSSEGRRACGMTYEESRKQKCLTTKTRGKGCGWVHSIFECKDLAGMRGKITKRNESVSCYHQFLPSFITEKSQNDQMRRFLILFCL